MDISIRENGYIQLVMLEDRNVSVSVRKVFRSQSISIKLHLKILLLSILFLWLSSILRPPRASQKGYFHYRNVFKTLSKVKEAGKQNLKATETHVHSYALKFCITPAVWASEVVKTQNDHRQWPNGQILTIASEGRCHPLFLIIRVFSVDSHQILGTLRFINLKPSWILFFTLLICDLWRHSQTNDALFGTFFL